MNLTLKLLITFVPEVSFASTSKLITQFCEFYWVTPQSQQLLKLMVASFTGHFPAYIFPRNYFAVTLIVQVVVCHPCKQYWIARDRTVRDGIARGWGFHISLKLLAILIPSSFFCFFLFQNNNQDRFQSAVWKCLQDISQCNVFHKKAQPICRHLHVQHDKLIELLIRLHILSKEICLAS